MKLDKPSAFSHTWLMTNYVKKSVGKALSLEVVLLAWPGKEDAASVISNSLRPLVDSIKILYNSSPHSGSPAGWIDLGQDAFFGKKFEYAIRTAQEEVQLFVVADAIVDDWVALVDHCKAAFVWSANTAIWAPYTRGTAWTPGRTMLKRRSKHELHVTAVDSIVWAVRTSFLKSLPNLQFAKNTFGWGIETAVAAAAHVKGMYVILNTGLVFGHSRGSGYNTFKSDQLQVEFFRSLPNDILSTVRRIEFIFRARKNQETKSLPFRTLTKVWVQKFLVRFASFLFQTQPRIKG